MTREEARDIMGVIVHMLDKDYDTERVEEAVEIAISALEMQPLIRLEYSQRTDGRKPYVIINIYR